MRNEAPTVVVAYGLALLVPIEGKPVIREVPDTRFERVINTHAMLARTRADKTWYLHVYDGWVSSGSLGGPWTQVSFTPLGLDDVAKQLAQSGTVDLLDGGEGATPKPALANGVPAIHVTEVPTELIVFKGQPNLVPITGTPLLWATNSATDVIVDTTNNAYYVLMAGRWFRAPALGGPWTFVASNALPPSFRQIPAKGTPASIVLASVAGTPQAQEAVIANSIPQTAAVARNGGPTFTPEFDGAPQWQPVTGTPLRYVANSKVPVIEVSPGGYYAVTGGVWFSASALTGPWVVATAVPGVIYTIPVSSPLHYVTYVHVYGYTGNVVYAGYTPGYLGTVVDAGGTVVYGTGYAYSPWVGSVWYGAPVTYGVAAMPVYNPYVGFTFGFAMGLHSCVLGRALLGRGVLPRRLLRVSVLRLGDGRCLSQLAGWRVVRHAHVLGRQWWRVRHDRGRQLFHVPRHDRHLQRAAQLESLYGAGFAGLQPHVQHRLRHDRIRQSQRDLQRPDWPARLWLERRGDRCRRQFDRSQCVGNRRPSGC